MPSNDIPAWADALCLDGADRDSFIDYYAEISIPKWYRDRLSKAELEIVELRVELENLRAKVGKIAAKRKQPDPE